LYNDVTTTSKLWWRRSQRSGYGYVTRANCLRKTASTV